MSQATLFGEPVLTETVAHARRTDPETSRDAATSVTDLRGSQAAILSVLRQGRADYETLIDRYNSCRRDHPDVYPRQSPSGLRTRVAELRDRGYVHDSGGRVTLPSGRHAIVWEATS
jgi:hypothetical protein